MNKTQDTQVQETWRERLRRLGKRYFELEEMGRLGFLDFGEQDFTDLKEGIAELNHLNRKMGKINKELNGLDDVETVLKKIRQLRIERVRKERAIRKAQKAEDKAKKQKEDREWRQKTPPYLGKGVSAGLRFESVEDDKLKSLGLPIISNAEEMAEAMGLTTGQISWLSYHKVSSKTDHYHRFQIPKRKGGFRTIASPKGTLRTAQSWILNNILSKISVHENAMAFRPNRSIVENAAMHVQKGVVIRMDMKDFFPSIQFRRVKGLFKSFGYNEGVATIFGLICTDAARIQADLDGETYYVALSERYLPQGACTSPAITNIICRRLDNRLTKLAQKFDYTYTRYADDIVISHQDKNVPVGAMLNYVQRVIEDEDFILNEEKTMVMRPHRRQSVTGVVVNEKINISKRDYKRFRSFLHHYEQEGADKMSEKLGKDATQYGRGYWAFINMVNPQKAAKIAGKHAWLVA